MDATPLERPPEPADTTGGQRPCEMSLSTPDEEPIPGPGVTRVEPARRWRERQPALRLTPGALLIWSLIAATGGVVALLPTSVAVVVTVGIWVCAPRPPRCWRRDVVPSARMLRR